MFDDSEISYSYDIEMNNDESVIKYLVDSTFYDQFSAEVLGVYIIYGGIPIIMTKELNQMAQILDHYIYLESSPPITKTKSDIKSLIKTLSIYLDEQLRKRYQDHHTQIREIHLIFKDATDSNIFGTVKSIESLIDKKKKYYLRQNNEVGISFCNAIQKKILKPLVNYTKRREDYRKKAIKALTKSELKLVWDEFKDSKLGLIQTYFSANNEKLMQLDANNTFQVDLNYVEWNGMPNYYICLKIFGQKWYLRIDDNYVSGLHKVNLIKL
jgi:hypothetical protein